MDFSKKNYRQINHDVMDDTIKLCNEDNELVTSIKESINSEYVVYHNDLIDIDEDGATTNIIISPKRTLEAARNYNGKKTAVLNFANNHSVGGTPWSAGAQEESLCRCSTLYPCLKAIAPLYHDKHAKDYNNGIIDFWGNDDLIYTKDVVVIKTDESIPQRLNKEDRFKVDVITCAAPELFHYHDSNKVEQVLKSRIDKILKIAKKENVKVLILGAFGCGAFHNPPEVVAKVFKEGLSKYHFDTVEFAVFCREQNPNDNYHIFKKIFENL